VSGARLRLGVGAGSTAADFTALGQDFAARFRRLDQSLAIMRHFSEAEIIELVAHTTLYIGFGRFNAIVGLEPA